MKQNGAGTKTRSELTKGDPKHEDQSKVYRKKDYNITVARQKMG